ncbi:hypothetical protein E1I69_05635 [Bacillus timonensis]|uniref:Uncharacterized protein n=1 Tax=Bacillus timonensis TaxID=1033734 RepID=A0A4V3V8A6_9BACI|nr:hypothetical protein [Bacillus timonensis]THE13983.1 hypothetical protein E1I69_05635 [Bacillus timonensis]
MLRLLGVVNSDEVNKYNIKFTVGALESAYSDNWQLGVPSYLGHDHTKPIAWTLINALHFEPGMVRTTNITYVPENEKESEGIDSRIRSFYLNKTTNFIKPYKDQLLEKLNPYLSEDYIFSSTESAAIIDKGIAKRVFPEIFETDDKHGLVLLSKLNPIAPGIYEKDGLLLYASSFFRRSFSRLNTLNTPFLKRFQEIGGSDKVTSKVLLDPDMVGLAGSYSEVFEFQYWWGPQFSDNLADIPIGVTTHKSSEKEILFNDVQNTEFWWYEQDNKKTFECEEVIVKPSLGISESNYGCRFVHSMIDESTSNPFHLDGAIRIYDEEGILNRWDVDIKGSGKNTDYNKLWRLDGDISVSEWKELISHYYRDNTLVGEYFGGEDSQKSFQPEILEKEDDKIPLSEYSPSYMKKGEGVRIALSYKDIVPNKKSGRKIRVTHSLINSKRSVRYIESDTLEIIKRLRKRGESLSVPPNTEIVAYEDLVTNFPMILHRGENAVDDANVTLGIILELCELWSKRNDDRTITFNISVEYESKEAVFSFAGHIEDILILFNDGLLFPNNESDVRSWCEEVAKNLTEYFPKANDNPKLKDMLKPAGYLYFDRRFIEEDHKLYWDEDRQAMGIELQMLKPHPEVIEEIEKGSLEIAPVFIVNQSKCSKCEQEYRNCNCTKYSDEGVFENMEDINSIGIFWTKRKA